MRTFETSDGLNLAYEDEGQGPAILCLAGLTRNMRDFDDLASAISGVRLIRMDYRGRGKSDYDPNPLNYTVEIEARDALELLDHLDIAKAAIIGSSRGGVIGMLLAAFAKHRLTGILLNDVGPKLDTADLGRIVDYVGTNPPFKNYDEACNLFPAMNPGFDNVPPSRWRVLIERMFEQTDAGLKIRYDPALRQTVKAAFEGPEIDLWPLFDACIGLPMALIRGANSQLLTPETTTAMRVRRPEMLFAEIPDRAHIPFLDEAESLAVINQFLRQIT
jgi:pimeloyl-ACP methyl ester carboxylesterase